MTDATFSDPPYLKPGYTHEETFPVIANIIREINRRTNAWAMRGEIVDCMLNDPRAKEIVERSIKKSTSKWDDKRVAGNMVDFWSKDFTTGVNPFLNKFSRQRIDDQTSYWCKEIGAEPSVGEGHVTITEEEEFKFTSEKRMEQYLVNKWAKTPFSQEFEIFEDRTGKKGVQYKLENSCLDILAISKDKKTFLVIELKLVHAKFDAVGQILHYMQLVQDQLAINDEKVIGAIVAEKVPDKTISALKANEAISVWKYEIGIKLEEIEK